MTETSLNRMERRGARNFKVGQLAELKSFEEGFRSAWFRCKIKAIDLNDNKILLEYYDFEEGEITWEKIYAKCPYGSKSKQSQKQLMMRPQYPPIYNKNETPAVNSDSQVCVMVEGTWKVGDLVDWFKDDCYWSATVIKLLANDKLQIELPMPPVGQRLEKEPTYDALCKDLRPSLDWSPRKGWRLPTGQDGETTCNAQLVFPSNQGLKSEVNALVDVYVSEEELVEVKIDDADVENVTGNASCSTSGGISDAENRSKVELNIDREGTLESCLVDLEELANRIKWIKSVLLHNNQHASSSSSWEFRPSASH